MGETALPRALHDALSRLVDRPDPHRYPLLVQRRPIPLDRPGLVPPLVSRRPGPLDPQRPRSPHRPLPEPQAGDDRRSRHRAARGRPRHRSYAVAGSRGGDVARRLPRDARHAGDRDGNGAPARVRPRPDVHPARHDRAGDRPHHLLARLRRHHRPRATARDRARVRGGGTRSGRDAAPGAAPQPCSPCSYRRR